MEGLKHSGLRKLEAGRADLNKPILCNDDKRITCLVYDKKFEGLKKLKFLSFNLMKQLKFVTFYKKNLKMRNKLDILISVNKAKKLLNKSLKNKKNYSETVETKASVNRIISKTVFSKNIPEFDNSAVDGFGFNYNSLKKFKSLKIIGESRPGFPFRKQIRSGEAIVYTGSYILKK